MKKELEHIPSLHNYDYSFVNSLQRLCHENIKTDYEFVDIASVWNKPKKTDITAIDLFCGCGGISKGLEMAGINVLAGLDLMLHKEEKGWFLLARC
ncbi:MAG: hypothetical protein ACI9CD_000056 [Candidatus Deianiraeaceae bacterium]|jgi:hypothetical protein